MSDIWAFNAYAPISKARTEAQLNHVMLAEIQQTTRDLIGWFSSIRNIEMRMKENSTSS